MLLSPDEHRMLMEICDETGLNTSDVVRQFIRREYASYGRGMPAEPLVPRANEYSR